jgi:hypothetical protein
MLRSRRSLASAVVLAAAAVVLGLFAGSATAGHASPPAPTTCTSNPTICTWDGQQGLPLQQQCDAQNDPYGLNQPYLLWIFTTGGKNITGAATLTLGGTGSGSYVGTAHGKEFHFVTPYFTPNSSLTATVSYGGDLGNAQLTISHGCIGPAPPDTTPPSCALIGSTTYTNSTEKSSITVTLQDSGSGIQSVLATGSNDTIVTSPFTAPTTNPVTVTASKTIQGQSATLKIVVSDAAGNQTTCDPVLRAGHRVTAHSSTTKLRGVSDHFGGLQIHLSSAVLNFGATSPLTLSGRVRNVPAGTRVAILSQAAGFIGLSQIASVTTDAAGRYSYRFHPAVGAYYAVSVRGLVSPSLRIKVQPQVKLERTASGHYRVDVTTTNPLFLTGKKVSLQELRSHRWVTIASTRLAKNSTDTGPAVISSGTFTARQAAGHRLRAVVAGTASYARGLSATING